MSLSGWEAIFFWVFALAALIAALLTIMARNAVHSALFLVSALVAVAALFVLLGAEFIAGAQLLVYVGGVMVLFLFVIMLVNVGAQERGSGEALFNRAPQVWASVVFLALLTLSLVYAVRTGYEGLLHRDEVRVEEVAATRTSAQLQLPNAATRTTKISDDTKRFGASLYRYAALPFEIASVLLLVAIVGSVLLARTVKQEQAADDTDNDQLEQLQPGTRA